MYNFFFGAVVIAFLYMYVPHFHKLNPTEYSASLPIRLEGRMSVNERLSKVEKLFENEIFWPESMAVYKGSIYTGLGDGRIVQITNKGIKEISRTGPPCEGQHEENICGRPLGMTFDSKGNLYVVDAYHGLFVINVNTGKKTHLLPASTYVSGQPLTFLNGLTLDEEGQALYITQSTSKWNISMVIISIIEHENSGRLLKYDLKQKIVSVLANDLSFPNGVELSHDKKSLLIAETTNLRILRYHLQGSKKGKLEPLPLVLPAEPDNISRNPRGNYWVGLGNVRTAESPNFYDRFSRYPLLRKAFLIFYHAFTLPISYVMHLIPSKPIKEMAFNIISARIFADIMSVHGIIVEFDDNGNIVQSLHAPNGQIGHISEVLEKDGQLYLGSWRNRYLGKVKL